MFTRPKNITIWKNGQNILAIPEIQWNTIHLKNIRDFDYGNGNAEMIQRYVDYDYDNNTLESCTLYSIPFGPFWIFSHLILGFHFEDGRELLLSVEARRRPDEDFSVIKGFLPYYGLIYIWGTYDDLIGLRLHARKDQVYSYQLNFKKNTSQKLFLDSLKRTESLVGYPEIYGSLFNNCTTNLIKHCTSCVDIQYPSFDYRVILSGRIEWYLQKMGWIKKVVRLEDC